AAGDLMSGMDTPKVLQSAGLPDSVKLEGKTFTADKPENYDPDTFKDMKELPQKADGHTVFQAKNRDEVFVEGNMKPTETAGPSGTQAPAGVEGPIFVRYKAGKGE